MTYTLQSAQRRTIWTSSGRVRARIQLERVRALAKGEHIRPALLSTRFMRRIPAPAEAAPQARLPPQVLSHLSPYGPYGRGEPEIPVKG